MNVASLFAQDKQTRPAEWDKIVEAGRKEGKVVVSIPSSADLRTSLEELSSSGSGYKSKASSPGDQRPSERSPKSREPAYAMSTFTWAVASPSSAACCRRAILAPVADSFLLSEVKDPKHWWGGHIWTDNAKKFIYTFAAYTTDNIWYNGELMKPEQIRSFDDLLDEKWKGKIGFLDPRSPGFRRLALVIPSRDQGRGISQEISRPETGARPRSAGPRRECRQRQAHPGHGSDVLHALRPS